MANLLQHARRLAVVLRYSRQQDDFGKEFIFAGEYGDIENLHKCIVERGVSFEDEHGQRPLHRASRRGHIAAVRMLLEYGSDPNIPDSVYGVGGYTAVQYAAHYNLAPVVRLLVSYGGDIFYSNQYTRPVTSYSQDNREIAQAINNGISDLYIHRSIAASQLNRWSKTAKTLEYKVCHSGNTVNDNNNSNNNNNRIDVNIDIWLLIIEYIPRHQLWTEVKTRFVTNKTKNWHSGQIFSTKHLSDACQNKIHSIKYNGEYDDDLYYSLLKRQIKHQIIEKSKLHARQQPRWRFRSLAKSKSKSESEQSDLEHYSQQLLHQFDRSSSNYTSMTTSGSDDINDMHEMNETSLGNNNSNKDNSDNFEKKRLFERMKGYAQLRGINRKFENLIIEQLSKDFEKDSNETNDIYDKKMVLNNYYNYHFNDDNNTRDFKVCLDRLCQTYWNRLYMFVFPMIVRFIRQLMRGYTHVSLLLVIKISLIVVLVIAILIATFVYDYTSVSVGINKSNKIDKLMDTMCYNCSESVQCNSSFDSEMCYHFKLN